MNDFTKQLETKISDELQACDSKVELTQFGIIKIIEEQDLHSADWNTLTQMGREISQLKTRTQWVLGMLGNAVSQRYGDLVKFADEIGQNYDSLRQYVFTYRKFISEDSTFHPDNYFGSVSWKVLALAATKSKTPIALVDELQDKGYYTFKQAYRAISSGETKYGIPKKPVIDFEYDPQTGKYKFVMDMKDVPLIDWGPLIPIMFENKSEQEDFRELLNRFNSVRKKSL